MKNLFDSFFFHQEIALSHEEYQELIFYIILDSILFKLYFKKISNYLIN